MRRWGERAREKSWNPCGRKQKQNGPDWALSVLDGVVSSVLSSSVVLCWIQCDWLLLDSGVWVIYWISRNGFSVGECVTGMFWFRVDKTGEQYDPKQYSKGRGFYKNVILVDGLVSVCVICCTEMSRYFCLGGWCCVSSGVSLHLVLAVGGWGGCRSKLWPASMCLKKWVRKEEGGKRGEGPSVAQCPKLPAL